MLFTIEQTKESDKELQTRINKLRQIALDHDGTFYLPYRNYATPDQMRNSYPELLNFISFKKDWDPKEIFSSDFYDYLIQSQNTE